MSYLRLAAGIAAALAAGLALTPVLADTAPTSTAPPPTATTATYGNWTIGCSMMAQADGSGSAQVCQMTTRLNLKGKDGQMRPLLAISIGTPPGAKVPTLVLQLPTDVALREGARLSFDKAGGDANAADKPQDVLADLTYLTCTPQVCVANTEDAATLLARLKGAKTLNVTFTALQGGRKIMVPVSLDGFDDGMAALGANTK
ncbi:hypothetical protein GC209_13130 [bacterium]|nr:hypothetical protein [bacterium]